jgi:hypothetical protein
MPCQIAVYHQDWTASVRQALPHLSKSEATVLALFSLGMIFARSCAVSAVTAFLAVALVRKTNTVRQQLREFCWEAEAKAGAQRHDVSVERCFVPLLGWVLSRWHGRQLALALAATTLGDRFAVLAISVVYRGCAIPRRLDHPEGRQETRLAARMVAHAPSVAAGGAADLDGPGVE